VPSPKTLEQQNPSSCSDWTLPSDWEQQDGTASTFQDSLSPRQMAVLEKLIENSIVPRLLLGSRTAFHPVVSDAPSSTPVTVENVGELAELVTKPDAAASIAYFEVLRAGGASVEMLFQDLLVPVARRLGELWDEDINDFMDVTRGASHLQQIVREYGDAFHSEARQPVSNRRMLLMTMPGEQHTLGISMVGEHFRRAGWHVWGGPPRTIDDILELVDAQWFDVIGLSLSRILDTAMIASDIARIRQASMNKSAIVQIGGRPFSANPDLVAAVGADATAEDGRQAVLQITAMIHSSPHNTP